MNTPSDDLTDLADVNDTNAAPWMHNHALPELPLMVVTIRDPEREAPWGHGLTKPITSTVVIPALCLRCLRGGVRTSRGTPRGINQHDDGAWYWVQMWGNPCGHPDYYEDVAREARQLAGCRGPGRWVREFDTEEARAASLAKQTPHSGLEHGVVPHYLTDEWVANLHQMIVNKRNRHVREFPIYTTRQLTMLTTLDPWSFAYVWEPAPATIAATTAATGTP